ncbi:hypothetical protein IG631_02815 [Alternaria alternata]|nr:hypothetical protein IG631_02815 [Alternaria alternata]
MTLALFQVQGTWVLCSRDMRRTEGISTNDCYDNDRKTRDLGIFGRLQRLLASLIILRLSARVGIAMLCTKTSCSGPWPRSSS